MKIKLNESSEKEINNGNIVDEIKIYGTDIYRYKDIYLLDPYVEVTIYDKSRKESYVYDGEEFVYDGDYTFDFEHYGMPSLKEIEDNFDDGTYELSAYLYYIEISKEEADKINELEEADDEEYEEYIEEIKDRGYNHVIELESYEIKIDKDERIAEEIESIVEELKSKLDSFGNSVEYRIDYACSTNSVYFDIDVYDKNGKVHNIKVRISDHAPNIGRSSDYNILVSDELYSERGLEDVFVTRDEINDVIIKIDNILYDESNEMKESKYIKNNFMKFSEWKKSIIQRKNR